MWGTGVNLPEIEVTGRSSQKVGYFSKKYIIFLMHCYQGSLSTLRSEVNSVRLSTIMSWIFKTETSGCFVWKRWSKIGFYGIPGTHKHPAFPKGIFVQPNMPVLFHLYILQNSRVTVIIQK
jgi:hypothetical protein